MPEPIPWDDLPTKIQIAVHDALESAITELATEVYDTSPPFDSQPPALRLAHHLARISAATIITERLTSETRGEAYEAGAVDGSPANYSDLAYAAGITREGARKRFSGAVLDARPGRPKKQVTVTLSGGHPQWDGQELEYDRESVYDPDLDDVGALLMIEDGSYPDHLSMQEGVDWRAHYAPESEDTRTVWVFQGWVPS